MTAEHIVQFQAGPYVLTGTLHLPDPQDASKIPTSKKTPSKKPQLIIGCHGLLANRSSPKQAALARACADHGMAYFRFDHRHCGESQGDPGAIASLVERCADLQQAVEALRRRPDVGPLFGLFGSSFGGTVALATAAQVRIPCLVTYAAPISSDFLHAGPSPQALAGHRLDPALAFDITPQLDRLHTVLVVHGASDKVVPIDHAHQIYKRAQNPKQLVIQPGGDHPMSDPRHQNDFLRQAVTWFLQFRPNEKYPE